MFEPEERIGIEATDYLIEQGFNVAESVYEGPDDIITDGEINFDDTHPQHDELMEQFVEHSVTVIAFRGWHPSAGWSSGEIRPISENFQRHPRAFEETSSCFQSQFESVDESGDCSHINIQTIHSGGGD